MHHHGRDGKHGHRHHGAAHEAVKQAGLQGLLAGIPAAMLFSARSSLHSHVGRTLGSVLNKGEAYAHGKLKEGKFAITAPMVAVVGAVIVVGAMLHGAWRGAKRGEEHSFAEAEEERRAQREAACATR